MAQPRAVSYGGEAVFDGVMMKGATSWSIAVRADDGQILTEVHPLSGWMTKGRSQPILRGIVALGTTVALGSKSLTISQRYRDNDATSISGVAKAAAWAVMALALAVIAGIFLGLPIVLAHLIPYVEDRPWLFSVIESAFRLTMILGYIAALGRNMQVQDVFRYHSAEHATIAAREAGCSLIPSEVAKFPNAHPRCGTAFLLLMIIVGTISHALVGDHAAPVLLLSRLVLLPIVAGVTYELVRLATLQKHSVFGRFVTAPGIWLQRLTTRDTSERHIEVAIAALNAVVAADERVAVANR
jgi:uncharacterized protein YqhQ